MLTVPQQGRPYMRSLQTRRKACWIGGSVFGALNSWPRNHRFDSQPVLYQVTTLGKLFTPTWLCKCTWSGG